VKKLIICFFIPLLFISCYNEEAGRKRSDFVLFEGYVALKKEHNGKRLLVIQDMTKEDIRRMSEDEILTYAAHHDSFLFYVHEKDYQKINVGQKIRVWYAPPVQESKILQVGAEKIQVIDK
jgi:Protein of unknown function (DUF3221)